MNDAAGAMCYLLCRAMGVGSAGADLSALSGRVDPAPRLAGTSLGAAPNGREREPAPVQDLDRCPVAGIPPVSPLARVL